MTLDVTVTDANTLVQARHDGWRSGYGNLVGKELGQWWGTKVWWVQVLVWVVLLNGVTTVMMLDSAGMTAAELVEEAVQGFLLMGAVIVPIGIVLAVQGSIVGEKELGTAAWLMSKPISRAAYILAKLTAHTFGFTITAVLIPSMVFAVEAALLLPEPVPYGPFALAVAVMVLNVLFYVVLTLALGCFFKGRGPIAGIGIGLILFGQFFKGMLPLPLVLGTPWLLGEVAVSFPLEMLPDFNRVIPMVAVGIGTLVLGYLAIWRFQREEF